MYVLVFVNYWIEKCTVKHWNWNLSLHALNAYVGLEMQLHLFFSSALGGYEELCTSFPNLVCSLFYICSQHFIIAAAFNINISMWLVWTNCLSQWPRGLRRGSAAARLLGLLVRIPLGHGCLFLVIFMCCKVDVSASGWPLVQRSPADCGASLCVI